MNLQNEKNYLIISASSGIAEKFCLYLINKKKVKLFLCARDIKKINKNLTSSNKVKLFKLNILKKREIVKTTNYFKKNKIKLNSIIFFNGKLEEPKEIIKINYLKWLNIFNINFLSNVYMTKSFFPFVKKFSYSKIIFFSGGGSFNSWEKFSSYSTAKTSLVRFCENLAVETKKYKIIVNCVAPGFIKTPIHSKTYKNLKNLNHSYKKELIANYKKKPKFENVIGLMNFLLSNKSLVVTGRTISANFDQWRKKKFLSKLKSNPNFLMMRRKNIT